MKLIEKQIDSYTIKIMNDCVIFMTYYVGK